MFGITFGNPETIYAQPNLCAADPNSAACAAQKAAITDAEKATWGEYYIWNPIKRGVAEAMLWLSGGVLFIAGILFNYAVVYTIIEMSSNLRPLAAIDEGWRVFRDLANIFFVFVLIYIAVSTILSLQSSATFKTLTRIIVVALLINFSLFFTKAMVDVSNIVTIQFYTSAAGSVEPTYQGLSLVIIKALNLSSYYDPTTGTSVKISDPQNMFTIGVMGSLLMLITAFVFFAAAILLVIRFVILIFLMITSPLAFVGSIVPQLGNFSSKWWHSLIDQCIFAPALMMFLWFTVKLIYSQGFQQMVLGKVAAEDTLMTGVSSPSVSAVAVVMNFLIVITFMVASLVVAKAAGAAGSSMAMNFAQKAAFGAPGWLARQGPGRVFNAIGNSKWVQRRAENSRLWSGVQKGAGYGGRASYDIRNLPGAPSVTKLAGQFLSLIHI